MNLLKFTALLAEQGYVLRLDKDFLQETAFQWLNTAILIAVLAILLYNPVRQFLRNRAERIRKQIEDAASNIKTAEALKSEYEQKMSNIETERTEILNQARQNAAANGKRIEDDARKEAEAIKSQAKRDIELERQKALEDVKKYIVDVASDIAGRWIAEKIDEKAQHKLIEDAIAGIERGGAAWQN